MNISTPFVCDFGRNCVMQRVKGYLRRSENIVRFMLGIRENTCMTVTVREELFRVPYRIRKITTLLLFKTDMVPSFFIAYVFYTTKIRRIKDKTCSGIPRNYPILWRVF